jgi:hypothetical protein
LFTVYLFTAHSKTLSLQSLYWQDDQQAESNSKSVTCPEENPKVHKYPYAKMSDFHTEIRNEKFQDIKHERFLLLYAIWSGVI